VVRGLEHFDTAFGKAVFAARLRDDFQASGARIGAALDPRSSAISAHCRRRAATVFKPSRRKPMKCASMSYKVVCEAALPCVPTAKESSNAYFSSFLPARRCDVAHDRLR
jgi:hypothetical protein